MMLWPKEFIAGCANFSSYDLNEVLAIQLVGWGNVLMGEPPPDTFYDVMEAAGKITGAFTSVECRDAADKLLWEMKVNAQNRVQ